MRASLFQLHQRTADCSQQRGSIVPAGHMPLLEQAIGKALPSPAPIADGQHLYEVDHQYGQCFGQPSGRQFGRRARRRGGE